MILFDSIDIVDALITEADLILKEDPSDDNMKLVIGLYSRQNVLLKRKIERLSTKKEGN